MCGINCFFTSRLEDAKGNVDWLSGAKSHIEARGPDNYTETYSEDLCVGFAHSRLAIVDLDDRSNQPFIEGDLTLVYNGEIYNHKQIRRELLGKGCVFQTQSDTEVLLKGYKYWGNKVFQKIDGMYSFAFYHASTKELIFGRDCNGEKPLYFSKNEHGIRLSSNASALSPGSTVSQQGLAETFKYGFCFEDRTLLNEVSSCRPGAIYKLDKSGLVIDWFSRSKVQPSIGDSSYGKRDLDRTLRASVEQCLDADVPVNVLLSGGIDSTLLLKYAVDSGREATAYTVSFKQYPNLDESVTASHVCELLGVDHKIVDFGQFDVNDFVRLSENNYHPMLDTSLLPSFLIFKAIKSEGCKVVISGDGADELFGGYKQYRLSQLASRGPKRVAEYLESTSFFSSRYMRYLFLFFAGASEFRRYLNDSDIMQLFRDESLSLKAADRPDNWLMYDQENFLARDILRKSDVASMLNSIEVRSPFLSREVKAIANSLKWKEKVSITEGKIILKSLLRDGMPEYPVNQAKRGFSIPVNELLRYNPDFRGLMMSLLFDQDYFCYQFLEKLILKLDQGKNVGELLFGIMSTLLWLRKNV